MAGGPALRGRQRLDHVERGADREIADGVEVELEPRRAQPDRGFPQHLRLDEQAPLVAGGVPGMVQVRGGHRGGERLAHAVEHQLDRGRPELAVAGLLAPRQQVVDLVETAVAVPPQRADHVAAEQAVVGRHEVGVERVRHAELARRADAGVLEAGDAQRVQVRLARDEAGHELGRGGLRHVRRDQAHRPVVQRARRAAGAVPLDPAVRRVGGARVDARDGQRRRVHPGAVVIPVRQEGGPPAGDRVQVIGRRQAAGEGRHGPAAAEHPAAGRQGRAVLGHGVQAFVPGPQADQVAAQALQAAADRVHVRVAEGRQRQPPAQVDDAGAAAGQLPHLVVVADRLDQAVADREGLDEPGRVRGRADLPAGQDKVRLSAAHRHSVAPLARSSQQK